MRQCFSPLSVPRPDGRGITDRISVPCGKCPACDLNRVDDWTLRAKHETDYSYNAWFVTLTYSDENLPVNSQGQPTLSKRDYQLFLKRLRKHASQLDIRYHFLPDNGLKCGKMRFMVSGEYSPHNQRPHYHFLIWNIPVEPNYAFQSVEDLISKSWEKGIFKIGVMKPGAANYTVSYIQTARGWTDEYRERPFIKMSLKPGIGGYYIKRQKEYHQNTGQILAHKEHGQFTRMPKYYAHKIFSKQQRQHNGEIKRMLAEKQDLKSDEYHLKGGNDLSTKHLVNAYNVQKEYDFKKSRKSKKRIK